MTEPPQAAWILEESSRSRFRHATIQAIADGSEKITLASLSGALDWDTQEKLLIHSIVCPHGGGFVVLAEQRQPERVP